MTTVTIENNVIKYKSGSEMVRVTVDVPKKIGKEFKIELLKRNRTMAGVIRDFINVYLEFGDEAGVLLNTCKALSSRLEQHIKLNKECKAYLSKQRNNEIKPYSQLHKKIMEV